MPKPYDAAAKGLIELHPEDWLALAGFTASGPVDVIDADLATVTADADRVLRSGGANPGIYHVELQAARDDDLPLRTLRYNVTL